MVITDAGMRDAGSSNDSGVVVTDAGERDAGTSNDGGVVVTDAGVRDGGSTDSGVVVVDAGMRDGGASSDGGVTGPDGGTSDAGTINDSGVIVPDAGRVVDGGLLVFLTRATYWPDFTEHAPGNTGLAAADELCNAIAQSALLPGTYRAWVSSASASALSRMTGTGPWVQRYRDGGVDIAFPTVASLTSTPLVPLLVHEFRLGVTGTIWTGTQSGGTASTSTCNGFTTNPSTAVFGTVGQIGSISVWTDNGVPSSCNTPKRLLCLQQTELPAAPVLGSGMKRMFVTSTTYTGDLKTAGARMTGLGGADALCATRAAAAGLTGTNWVAWLSSNTVNAWDRVADVGPWYQLQTSGTSMLLTFTNKSMLRSLPSNDVSTDETGALRTGDLWTGTNVGGQRTASTCSSFESGSNTVFGTFGTLQNSTSGWTNSGSSSCSSTKRLLCLEQ